MVQSDEDDAGPLRAEWIEFVRCCCCGSPLGRTGTGLELLRVAAKAVAGDGSGKG